MLWLSTVLCNVIACLKKSFHCSSIIRHKNNHEHYQQQQWQRRQRRQHVRSHQSGATDATLGRSNSLARRCGLSRFVISTIAPPARTHRMLSRAPTGGGQSAAAVLECLGSGTRQAFGFEQGSRGRVEFLYVSFGICRTTVTLLFYGRVGFFFLLLCSIVVVFVVGTTIRWASETRGPKQQQQQQ